MSRTEVFRRRIGIGFGIVALLALLISAGSFFAVRSVVETKDLVISNYARDLLQARELQVASEQKVAAGRAYLLTGEREFLDRCSAAARRFRSRLEVMKSDALGNGSEESMLQAIERADRAHQTAMDNAVRLEKQGQDPQAVAGIFEGGVQPKREELENSLSDLVHDKESRFNRAILGSKASARRATDFVVVIGAASVLLAGAISLLSARTLNILGRAEAEIRELNQNLEQRIQERTSQLQTTLKELDGFAYTVAHDLRAPLRAMAGFSRVVLEDFGSRLDPPGHDHLRRIEEASRRMDELIRDLLEYSRVPYEESKLVPIELFGALEEALETVRPELVARKARVDVEPPRQRVMAERKLLHRVLVNLLSNAVKFVSPGVTPFLRVRSAIEGNAVRLSIEDNGIGIPREHQERIFGVFQRLNRAEDYPGTGIGLAIARRALERMGGRMGVESEVGKGSRFWVELPSAP